MSGVRERHTRLCWRVCATRDGGDCPAVIVVTRLIPDEGTSRWASISRRARYDTGVCVAEGEKERERERREGERKRERDRWRVCIVYIYIYKCA